MSHTLPETNLLMHEGLAALPQGRVPFRADNIPKTHFWDGTPTRIKKEVLVDLLYSLTHCFCSPVLTCFSICWVLKCCNFTANLTMSSVGLFWLCTMIQLWRKGTKKPSSIHAPPKIFSIGIQSRPLKKNPIIYYSKIFFAFQAFSYTTSELPK